MQHGAHRQRRQHLLRRSVIPRHQIDPQVGVWFSVGHHAAGGDDAAEAGRKYNLVRRQIAEIIAGRSDDEDTLLVERVHRIGPGLGGNASHAHRHDVNRGPG